MKRRSPLRLVLVALAILAALSHVCVLPHHPDAHAEHAAPSAPPAADSQADDASCEAVSPASPHALAGPAAAVAVVTEPPMPVVSNARLPLVLPPAARSSPLFLVHRSLLI